MAAFMEKTGPEVRRWRQHRRFHGDREAGGQRSFPSRSRSHGDGKCQSREADAGRNPRFNRSKGPTKGWGEGFGAEV